MSFFKTIFGWSASQAPPPPPEKKLDKGDVQAIAQIILPASPVRESLGSVERRSVLSLLGQDILGLGAKWRPVDWTQFTHMHGEAIIRDTKWEGGSIGTSILAWQYFIDLWLRDEAILLPMEITKTQLRHIREVLSDLYEFYQMMPPQGSEPIASAELIVYAKKILARLQSKLRQKNKVTLPLGYRGGVGQDGHAIPCTFSNASKGIGIHGQPLNLGNASGRHAVLNFTTTADLISLRAFPALIDPSTMWNETGLAAFCKLIRLHTDPPDPKLPNIEGDDVYDILCSIGTLQPDLGSDPVRLAAPGQKGGVCPETGVRNVVHDAMIDLGISEKGMNFLFLNMSLCSLIAGFHTFLASPSAEKQAHLLHAIEKFGIAVEDYKKDLSSDEYMSLAALLFKMKKEACRILLSTVSPKAGFRQNSIQPVIQFPSQFPHVELDRITQLASFVQPQNAPQKKTAKDWVTPVWSSKTLQHDLVDWTQHLSTCNAHQSFDFLLACVNVLPLPEWEKNDIWDTFSEKEIPDLIAQLECLVKTGLKDVLVNNSYYSRNLMFENVVIIYSVFAVIDKLARRLNHTHLSGFASPFIPLIYTLEPADFLALPLGEHHARYSGILNYFNACSEACKNNVIFPIAPILSIEEYLNDTMRGYPPGYNQGVNHIYFLQTHLFDRLPGTHTKSLLPAYIDMHVRMERFLPPEVCTLYYFAYLAATVFFNDGKTELKYPQSLAFTKALDDGGKAGVEIEDREQKTVSKHPEKNKAFFVRDFQVMSPDAGEHFISFFDSYHSQFTTNQCVCARLSVEDAQRYKITESVYRDLLRITRSRNLSSSMALQWASDNLLLLEHPGIRKTLYACFFAPPGLYANLRDEPLMIQTCRGFVMEALNYYRDNTHHLPTILYLIHIGICFESQYIALYGPKDSQDTLRFYSKKLEKFTACGDAKQQLEVRDQWMFAQTLCIEKTADQIVDLYKHYFDQSRVNSQVSNYEWLHKFMGRLFRAHGEMVKNILQAPGYRNDICSALCNHFLPETAEERKGHPWEGKFPVYSCKGYTLNFVTGEILYEQKGKLVERQAMEVGSAAWKEMTKEGVQFWQTENKMESVDGNMRVLFSDGGWILERLILVKGRERWGRIHDFGTTEIDKHNLDFLNYTDRYPLVHYILNDRESGDPDIFTYNYKKNLPEFQIVFTSAGSEIIKLDTRGYPLPSRLVNLQEVVGKTHPLYLVATRFAHPSRMLCFVNTATQQVEELHFFYIGLRFVRDDVGLACQGCEGFYLRPDLTLEELNHFPAAMVLENNLGAIKVIIPSIKCTLAPGDFSTELVLSKDYFTGSERYFWIFDFDLHTKVISHPHRFANLYLAYILKLQRQEKQALTYLRTVSRDSFTSEENTFLNHFSSLRDRSPAALAFNCHLIELFIDSHENMREEKFSKKMTPNFHLPSENYLRWALTTYCDYLKEIHDASLSTIHEDSRLTLEQERAILRYFKKLYKDKLPQLIELRYALLCTGKDKVTAKIAPKQIPLRPSIYAQIKEPENCTRYLRISHNDEYKLGEYRKLQKWEDATYEPHSNRMTVAALEVQFPSFYEQARQCPQGVPHPFDLTLLTCLHVEKEIHLGSVLFYVRHFPHHFAQLSLEQATTQKAKARVLMQIFHVIDQLATHPEYIKFRDNFLKAEGTFTYTRNTELRIKSVEATRIGPLQLVTSTEDTHPLEPFRKNLFIRTEEPTDVPAQAPFLDPTKALSPDTLAGDLEKDFADGYTQLQSKTTPHYRFLPENRVLERKAIENKRDEYHVQLVAIRRNLITKMNNPFQVHPGGFQQETEFQLAEMTGQKMTLLPETIMQEAILKGDSKFLERHCPLLTHKEVAEIHEAVCEYYRLLVLYQMCGEAMSLIDKLIKKSDDLIAQNDLATLLDFKFPDCRIYPEIYFFKVTEGKHPRPEQMRIYTWVCEGLSKGENRLFQHRPGGGKTDYLTPLLMLRARMLGLMPVFFSTPMMYAVDKANLGFTLSKVGQHLYYLEVGLHTKLSPEDLQYIYEQLLHYHAEGKGLIMTPQTYYSIRLQYFFAGLVEKNEAKVKYLSLILDFFELRCLQIGDEAHATYDPLTRAIYGLGEYFFLPEHERALFLQMLKPLLGIERIITETGKPLHELARMGSNQTVFATPDDVKEVRKTLAQHMSTSGLLGLPLEVRPSFISYWINNSEQPPPYLQELLVKDKTKADQIALVGYFLLEVLPQLLRMRTELDHAPSIFQEEEFHTPCHHKTPSTAQYDDPYMTCSTTIKGTVHKSLTENQIRNLVMHLLKKNHHEEQAGQSDSANLFAQWVEKTACADLHLKDVSLSSPSHMEKLTQALSKNPSVLEYYLRHFILPQIGYCLKQLQANPTHLLNGFKIACLFSATPISRMIYPRSVKEVLLDPAYEAEVIAEWCKEKNQDQMFVDSPSTFFTEAKENYTQFWSEGKVLTDPMGFFCDSKNEEIAKKWLDNTDLDGVFYFKEAHTLNVDKDEKVMLMMRSDPKNPLVIGGTNIIDAALKKRFQEKWNTLKLGTYFDAGHTESANILQKIGTTAFVFVGDNLTTPRLIQALLRLRGWMDKKMIQRVIWVYPKEVAKKIPRPKLERVDGASLYRWTVQNAAEAMKKPIILAAFQEIAYEIERPASEELKKHLHDPKAQMAVMEKYSAGFLTHSPHDPSRDFAHHPSEIDTDDVLKKYAVAKYAEFGYRGALDWESATGKAILRVITDVKGRIAKIMSNCGGNRGLSVELHTRLKKETEQIDFRPRPFDPISAEPIYGDCGIDNPSFPNGHVTAQNAYNSKGLVRDMFIENNQLKTALISGEHMEAKYLKPIDFFVIVILENKKEMAIVLANEITSTSLKKLIKGTDNREVKHKAFLVSSSGNLIQRGHGTLAPAEADVQRILKSPWMQDLVIDAALLRGQIVHPDRLLERLKTWPDFESFWARIVESQPNPETANQKGMKRLLEGLKK